MVQASELVACSFFSSPMQSQPQTKQEQNVAY